MSSGIILLPASVQPSNPTGIAKGNPLAESLVFAGYPTGASFYDAVNGRNMTATNTPTYGVTRNRAAKMLAASTQYFLGNSRPSTVNTWTIATLAYATVINAQYGVVGIGQTTGDLRFMGLQSGDGGNNRWRFGGTWGDGTGFTVDGTSTRTAGVPYFVVGRMSSTTLRSIWVNGVKEAEATGSVPANSASIGIPFMGIRRTDTLADPFSGGVLFYAAWNRALADSEIMALSRNPWQVFAQPTRRLWVIRGASGPATHTTSGVLTGPGAAVAGTAVHKTLHTTSGALTGPGAAVAGTAKHPHLTSGVLAGQGAVVVGTAAHKTLHTTSGALTGPGAAIAGTATHPHTTSGVLTGSGATLSGASEHTATSHATSGILLGPGAVLAGVALLTRLAGEQTSGGYYEPKRKRRTKEDIRADRIRFGILKKPEAVEAVEEVATAVIQARDSKLALEKQEQAELLQRILVERGIVLKAAPRIEAVLMAVIQEEITRQEDQAIVQLLFNM